jgi:hypothetical protein
VFSAVCNQFNKVSKCKLFPFKKVPQKMFRILKPPNGTSSSAKPLHPELLKQYDVSQLLPESSESRHVFQNVLRHPRVFFFTPPRVTTQSYVDAPPPLISTPAINHAIPVYQNSKPASCRNSSSPMETE